MNLRNTDKDVKHRLILYNSTYIIILKRQNNRHRSKISDCQGLGVVREDWWEGYKGKFGDDRNSLYLDFDGG